MLFLTLRKPSEGIGAPPQILKYSSTQTLRSLESWNSSSWEKDKTIQSNPIKALYHSKHCSESITNSETKMKLLYIVYASETGTSEDAAFSFYRRIDPSSPSAIQIKVINALHLDEYSDLLSEPDQSLFLFLLSTAGDGDVPKTFKRFWNSLLKRSLPPTLLQGVSFAVFGFGDSSYEKYNACARKFHVRMSQLGAKSVVQLGLGDDQAKFGYFGSLDRFLLELTNTAQSMGFEFSLRVDPIFRSSYVIRPYSSPLLTPQGLEPDRSNTDIFRCKVIRNERLTSIDWSQNVRFIRLERENVQTSFYESGDVAVVYYKNESSLVERAVTYFLTSSLWEQEISRETPLTIMNERSAGGSYHLPSFEKISLSELFESHLEIGGIPKPSYFHLLSQNTDDVEEKEKLLEMASASGIDLYYQYCLKERRSYIDVLEDFPRVHLSLQLFLEICPKLIPRKYSIASFPSLLQSTDKSQDLSCQPNQLDLCVAVAEYITPYRRRRHGLCSTYLSQLISLQDYCSLSIEKGIVSDSRIKEAWFKQNRPLICIGPGTGIAPIRSLAVELLLSSNNGNTSSVADSTDERSICSLHIFFGCRKRDKDFLFQQDWETLQRSCGSEHPLVFKSAFSQEQLIKRYVTHLLKESSVEVWRLLQQVSG